MAHPAAGGGFEEGTDSLADAFYPLYDYVFADESDFVADVETKLAQAQMTDPVEVFIAKGMGIGVIVGGLLWLLGLLLGFLLFMTGIVEVGTLIGLPVGSERAAALLNAIKIPAMVIFTGVFFGAIGFAFGFGGYVGWPYLVAGERKREINMLLPDAISFMYALSIGGLNQLEILEAIARADDTYGEVSQEFRSIIQETQYFDTDYRTAIRNRSMETPSDELAQFLTDMLSIINSGGDMTAFLNDKKQKHMRTAQRQQELTLETLELFGEMYMTLSLFPLLLIIILVIMGMMGNASSTMLYGTVYGLIPLTGAGFLVLISTVKQDEPGDGYLLPEGENADTSDLGGTGLLDLGLIERFAGSWNVFDRVRSREGTHETWKLLKRPHLFFRDHPPYVLLLTVPATAVLLGLAITSGSAPTVWRNEAGTGMIGRPVWGTFLYVYVPLYLNFLPLAIFREWNQRSRRNITAKLSENLRKLSSANDTGMTLLESLRMVSETQPGKLGEEFEIIHAKVTYGMSLKDAMREFNNKYHIPRLARTVKLITKAQEASSQITEVLSTAAQASENQDDIERERKSRTRMQVVIILMTYLTLLAVMAILKTQFVDVVSGLSGGAQEGGGEAAGGAASISSGIDTSLLSLLFFHAVTMQAVISGLISGYIRDAELLSGVKFVIVLQTIALVTWIFVT